MHIHIYLRKYLYIYIYTDVYIYIYWYIYICIFCAYPPLKFQITVRESILCSLSAPWGRVLRFWQSPHSVYPRSVLATLAWTDSVDRRGGRCAYMCVHSKKNWKKIYMYTYIYRLRWPSRQAMRPHMCAIIHIYMYI